MAEVNHRLPGNSRFVSVGLQMEPAEFDKPGPEIFRKPSTTSRNESDLLRVVEAVTKPHPVRALRPICIHERGSPASLSGFWKRTSCIRVPARLVSHSDRLSRCRGPLDRGKHTCVGQSIFHASQERRVLSNRVDELR